MNKFLAIMSIGLLSTGCQKVTEVDVIIHHARIYTVDVQFSMAEAMAVKDGKIIAIGTNEEISAQFWAKESFDLRDKFVYPGFIDAHSHFISLGEGLVSRADLTGTKSFADAIERLREFETTYPAEWLVGRGWDQNDWENKSFPTKELLDEIWPNKPVYLTRIDGHAALVNSKAMELAGIQPGQSIDGGEIVHEKGQPTGIFIDNAMDIIKAVIPAPTEELLTKAIERAEKECFAVGLTSVCDAGLESKEIFLLQKMQEANQLNMRIYAMLTPTPQTLEDIMLKGIIETDKLTVRSVKLYADGALGSRGACLIHDYSDQPNWKGLMLSPQAWFDSLCSLAEKHNYQVNTHAIGDSANRVILQTYARFLQGKNDKRWRIEHAQVVHPDDFHLFGEFNIVPSVQPTHATSDMYWADERLGAERLKSAYAYKQLLQENSWIPLGTDFPIEKIDPLLTFFAATARKDLDNYPTGGFQTENALTREDALRGTTIWAAKAGFEEHKKGSLEVGKFADFVILNQDLMNMEESDIPKAKILMTFVNGKRVYYSGE